MRTFEPAPSATATTNNCVRTLESEHESRELNPLIGEALKARSTSCPGELVEEPDVVGAFGRLAHHFVDLVSVRPDENAPAIGLDVRISFWRDPKTETDPAGCPAGRRWSAAKDAVKCATSDYRPGAGLPGIGCFDPRHLNWAH